MLHYFNSDFTIADYLKRQFRLYLSFGETMAEQYAQPEYPTNPYKFNGKELDTETGLYYYSARYYNPRTSVWLSVDPLAEKYSNISPFAYCVNNPVKFVDPDGRKIIDCFSKNDVFLGSGGNIDKRNRILSQASLPSDFYKNRQEKIVNNKIAEKTGIII